MFPEHHLGPLRYEEGGGGVVGGTLPTGSVTVAMVVVVVVESSFCQTAVFKTFPLGEASVCVVVVVCRNDGWAPTVTPRHSAAIVRCLLSLEHLACGHTGSLTLG